MQGPDETREVRDRRDKLLASLRDAVPAMQRRAVAQDRDGGFPTKDVALLRGLGALAAPLPVVLGGLGMGTAPDAATDLMEALRLLGRGNLSVGRVYEAHVNALRLIVRYGSAARSADAATAALDGHLFGLWVTDAPDMPLHVDADGTLVGAKAPCSAAGHATRALVTARLGGTDRMLLVAVPRGETTDLSAWDTHGMRATGSGRVAFDGLVGTAVGAAGDYLRQPDFSAGAWRTSAVTLGGLEALVAEAGRALAENGRDNNPHQQARMGEALIARETARLWVWRAACLGEAEGGDAQDIANGVNLARLAVESACLEAMRLVQRSLGLAAFRRGTLVELLLRDLATYLRQPAPDVTLTEAARHFLRRDLPPLPGTTGCWRGGGRSDAGR